MAFKIKNLRPTFLTIELASQPVTINSRGEAGPFEDAEKSPGLKVAENRGDVALFDAPIAPTAAQLGAEPKPAKPTKEDKVS